MKKTVKAVLLLTVLAMLLASCSAVSAIMGAANTKYVEYEFKKNKDIYGEHIKYAVLIDQKTEGLAASYFEVRLIRNTTDGVTESYGINFRHQSNMGYDSYYDMWEEPVLKVDGKIFKLQAKNLSQLFGDEKVNAGNLRITEKEFTISDELVSALKNASEIIVQYYSKNNKEQLVTIGNEGLQATKEFLK
jgi:hypothetical protein